MRYLAVVSIISDMNKPRILITNDDGILAPGIKHLWGSVKSIADPYTVAPKTEQSGTSVGVSVCKTIHIEAEPWQDNAPAWSVTGTPVDCVKAASSILLPFTPDLVVSGINRGSNAGRTVLYSGTVGGTIEATLRGLQAIAFSSFDHDDTEYELFTPHITRIISCVLAHPLPPGTLLNVNFPSMQILSALGVSDALGIKLTRQGKQYWVEDHLCHTPFASYFVDAKLKEFEEAEDSDIFWLQRGYIACVPIHVDELTDWNYVRSLKDQFESQTSSQTHQGAQAQAVVFSPENGA